MRGMGVFNFPCRWAVSPNKIPPCHFVASPLRKGGRKFHSLLLTLMRARTECIPLVKGDTGGAGGGFPIEKYHKCWG